MTDQDGIPGMPAVNQAATAAEQGILHAARACRERCACGEAHDDGADVTPAVIVRMRAYVAAHPGHQFVVDDDEGLVAAVIVPAPGASGPLRVLACSGDLTGLLDEIGAPSAEDMS